MAPEPKINVLCFWMEVGDELNKLCKLLPSFCHSMDYKEFVCRFFKGICPIHSHVFPFNPSMLTPTWH